MRDTVFVFARAPRLGMVKRRLAREIGERAALRFHRATLTRLLRALAGDRRFATVLAVIPDRARVARPRGVAVVGCDIPDLGTADVAAAFRALGGAHACFGPATDGGY